MEDYLAEGRLENSTLVVRVPSRELGLIFALVKANCEVQSSLLLLASSCSA